MYDLDWQLLRMEMKGDFASVEGVSRNVVRMENYLNNYYLSGCGNVKKKRIINLLSAVLLGYGNKPQFADAKKAVKAYLTEKQRSFDKQRYDDGKKYFSWSNVSISLQQCDNFIKLAALHADLMHRVDTANKRRSKMENRQDLETFINMLEARLDV